METEPQEVEGREAFLVRLRRTVNWLNASCVEDGLSLCTNQKVRAEAVMALQGARSKW